MKNRAKCKLCNSIIESFHRTDLMECDCGEISVYGGPDLMECASKDWKNFIRIDDLGNEVIPKIVEKGAEVADVEAPRMTYQEKVDMLVTMVNNLENLPPHVMSQPINHYDFYSYFLVIANILSSSDKN